MSKQKPQTTSLTAQFLGRPAVIVVRADGELLKFDRSASGDYRSGDFTLRLGSRTLSERAVLIDVDLSRGGAPFKLEAVRFSVALAAVEVHRFRLAKPPSQCGQMSRSSYIWWLHEFSSANVGAPFIMAYNRRGINKGFLGYIDQVRDTYIAHDTSHHHEGPDEETINLIWLTLQRPHQGQTITTSAYKDTLLFSLEPEPHNTMLRRYVDLVDRELALKLPPLPEACTEPVWCSWYAFRTDYDHDRIVENARLAAKLGFKNVIMDAHGPSGGWGFYLDAGRTADALRGLGLRPILWLAPYHFYKQLQGAGDQAALLAVSPEGKTQEDMCPMAKGTAEFVAERVERLMREQRLDGLKLDFLDQPALWNCAARHEHAYQTLGEGTDACMAAMHKAITSVKPDAIIEFRQNYANINNRRYGNCFRCNDAPYDFDHIRRETFQVWPYSKGVPVHADYAYWHPAESLSNKAIFMACIIYGCVPTLSMDLRNFTEDESRLVRVWLDFYARHKETLLWGELIPMSFDPHVSVSRIESPAKTIFGLFSETPPALLNLSNDPSALCFINGTNAPRLLTAIEGLAGTFACQVLDPFHRPVSKSELRSDGELRVDLPVPIGGLAVLRRL